MGVIIKQGHNEYSLFFYGEDSCILGISKHKTRGNLYTGKRTSHSLCLDCGKIIGSVMGGMKRHAVACKNSNEQWAKQEIIKFQESLDWGHTLSKFDKDMMKYLERLTK